jgi:hypothetical protein
VAGVKLILFHPGISKIDCQDCIKRLYDFETGTPKTYEAGPHRELKYITKENGHKPPCRSGKTCPKGTPETAEQNTLNSRNMKTIQLFIKRKATGFVSMSELEKNDPIVASNFAVLDGLWREYERQKEEANSASMFGQALQVMSLKR